MKREASTKLTGGVSVVLPRLDEKPWGGRRLERYGLDLPANALIGEALVTAGEAEIVSGVAQGQTLADVVSTDPAGVLGDDASTTVRGRVLFPLLVKLIDAHENLSIQVHPNDEEAERYDRLGKTEAWHVLSAEAGAFLYVGLRNGVSMEEFQEAAAKLDGSSSDLLRRIPAQPNSTMLIPAGTVHALGAGVLVYEIQQPSDVTFRLDDWGRVDAEGNPREMHLEEGFGVLCPESRPDWIEPVDLAAREGRRHLLTACDKFALERIALPGGGRYILPVQKSPQVVTVLTGRASIGEEHLDTGMSAVVWPGSEGLCFDASEPTVALRGWVPDVATDVRQLTRNTGSDTASLEQLSGSLPDIHQAFRSVEGSEQ